jgi:hypothetical protein
MVIGLLSSAMFVAAGAQGTKKVSAAAPRIFEVASIAYWDFDNELKSQDRSRGIPQFNIRNYTVKIMEYSGRVYVTFSVRPFHGELLGGSRHYVLNETTGEILEHTGEK